MDERRRELLAARATVFKALGHPSRLALIDALAGGTKCVCDLNEVIDADLSTVSRHLAVLRAAGLVSSERRSNRVYYTLRCPCVTQFYGCVETVLGVVPAPVVRGGG